MMKAAEYRLRIDDSSALNRARPAHLYPVTDVF